MITLDGNTDAAVHSEVGKTSEDNVNRYETADGQTPCSLAESGSAAVYLAELRRCKWRPRCNLRRCRLNPTISETEVSARYDQPISPVNPHR